ncbi:MAG: PAS domain-containing protein [Deltaproteobacteria bacterium]|nr:PAS domain-containing protein [Deltaproteobacteria bacterium]
MKLRARGKLFVASVAVVALVVLVTGMVAERELRAWLLSHLQDDLERQLDAACIAVVRAQPSGAGPADLLADELGAALQARVTLIRLDGTVAGDSRLTLTELPAASNHADRTEVQEALRAGRGHDQRRSATVDEEMMYAARSIEGDQVRVVRVALPITVVEQASARLRMLVVLAGLVGLGVAVAMSSAASQVMTRTLRELVAHARSLSALAAGGAAEGADGPGADEIVGLRGTLEQLAAELDRSVAALAEERGRLGAVLEAMKEGVVALDRDGQVKLVNPAARRLLAIEGDPAGNSLLALVRAPTLADLVTAASAGEVATGEVATSGGAGRTLAASAAPTRGAGGVVLVLHDVTEVRRLERMRRDFVANVSHELRTPAAVIRANAETLLLGAIDDHARARSFVEAIDRNAERLARILADLLDLARIESGALRLEPVDVALGPLCDKVRTALQDRARARDQRIVVEADQAAIAHGDPSALEQVLVNLLDNALKYTPPGGTIVVRAQQTDAGWRLEVHDDGPGIEPHHWPRLFERFYRVDAGRSREAGGTGLGLAIVKHLVEAQGGHVGVGAAPGRGSLFWVELPRAGAAKTAPS